MIPFDNIKIHFEAKKGQPVEVAIQGTKFVANCPNPNHPDKHPSCVGDLGTGHYKCLECGAEGTVEMEPIPTPTHS
jgi:hypothetical protein